MFERRALVELAADVPETGLSFLRDDYPVFDAAVPLGPTDTDQLAVARRAAYGGLHARPAFRAWDGEQPGLHREWVDAGERLEPRLGDLNDVTSGRTEFAAAAELACSAIKHGLDVPSPFAPLDADAYRDHGAEFAVRWPEMVFETTD